MREIYSDLQAAQQFAYAPSGLSCSQIVKEVENKAYSACDFEMNDRRIKFRAGKITPTKIGQFATLWKRIGEGPIVPFDLSDPVDLFVISVRTPKHFGQFVFPKAVLHEKGFVSREGRGGKRAMRAYPPWDIVDSPQAMKTQDWQLLYFFEIYPDATADVTRVRQLFQ